MDQTTPVRLASGKLAFPWSRNEKPSLNHWYLVKDDPDYDYWRIRKDFYCKERNITYYKIEEYFNGDLTYSGKTLAQCREIMRDFTYRMVI